MVTAEEAIIEPFGITVQPCRLDSASEGAAGGLSTHLCLIRAMTP